MMKISSVRLLGLLVGAVFSVNLQAAQVCDNSVAQTTPTSEFTGGASGGTVVAVTDDFTGLMWRRCVLGMSGSECATGSAQSYTWQTALQAVATVNADPAETYADWRLPNIKELASIVEMQCHSPASNLTIFPETPMVANYNTADPQQVTVYDSLLWSATPSSIYNSAAPSTGRALAWGVNFIDGGIVRADKSSTGFVRLVRDTP